MEKEFPTIKSMFDRLIKSVTQPLLAESNEVHFLEAA